MKESLDDVVAIPSRQAKWNLAKIARMRARFRIAVQYDIDLMSAPRQRLSHTEEADLRHVEERKIRTIFAPVNARDTQPDAVRPRIGS